MAITSIENQGDSEIFAKGSCELGLMTVINRKQNQMENARASLLCAESALTRVDARGAPAQYDLGTRSIAEVVAVVEEIRGPSRKDGYIHPDNFSKLSSQDRLEISQGGRRRSNDIFSELKQMAKNLLMAQMVLEVLGFVTQRIFGLTSSRARLVSLSIVLIILARRWGHRGRLSTKPLPKGAPKVYPLLGILPAITSNRKTVHKWVMQTARATNWETLELPVPITAVITLMDPRDREYVLKTNPWNYIKNLEDDPNCLERIFAEILGRGIFATDGSEWFMARKIASHMFSGTALQKQMEHVFNQHADRVVDLLKAKAIGKTLDIQNLYQAVVFDAFCEIAFGTFPNATDLAIEGKTPQFLNSFDCAQRITSERVMYLPIVWNLSRVFGKLMGIGVEAEHAEHLRIVDEYIYSIVDERLKETDVSSRMDLLSLYIQYSRSQKSEQFSREDYRDIIANCKVFQKFVSRGLRTDDDIVMVAGRDTTSCTLTFATLFLGHHQTVLDRLEAAGLFKLGGNPTDAKGSRHVSWDDSKLIPFADAVVNEVLRMAPPVGSDLRVCAHDDILPSGIPIRRGTRAMFPIAAIGRDPFLWNQPDSFVPERWMRYDSQGVPQPVRRADDLVHPIFFGGRRICLGKDMARFETIVFMSKVFANIKFEPLIQIDKHEIVNGPVSFIEGGLPCRLLLRADRAQS